MAGPDGSQCGGAEERGCRGRHRRRSKEARRRARAGALRSPSPRSRGCRLAFSPLPPWSLAREDDPAARLVELERVGYLASRGVSCPRLTLSLHFQPFCSTITPSNNLQDELDAIFKDDVLKHWDEMEQADSKADDGHNHKRLPLLCYGEDKEVSSNSGTMVAGADQPRVRPEAEMVLTPDVR